MVLALVALSCAVAVAATDPALVRFRPFSVPDFLQLVTSLLMVALLLERVLEVFLTSWRGEGATRLKRHVKAATQSNAASGPSEEDQRLARYKAETQRIAFFAGTALGIVVAALGIRILELLVDTAVLESVPHVQRRLFRTADVLLTGAVMGGGSDALHRLVSVFTRFLDSTAPRARVSAVGGGGGV